MIRDLKNHDEEGRVRALERLDILDSTNERPFEDIVGLVEQVLSVPICAVTLVDRERQWFKAERGVNAKETPRNISFCSHTIEEAEPFIIVDATADPRFANNPLVAGGLHIRSYVGIPLKTSDGYNIGALCALDVKPRHFTLPEIEILRSFAKMAMNEIELRQIATTDWLTGALTRGAWTERAEAELARYQRRIQPLSLLLFDIDKFKSVNDTFGHPAGDRVIATLAETCMTNLRKPDLFGRFGGEEFVALLPETDIAGAVRLAERCRQAFEATGTQLEDGQSLTCSVSIGAAENVAGAYLSDLIARADAALYKAKESGRNCTVSMSGLLSA
mgnify:CR=1 FL=1|tara:strand:- start:732 stop:1727 length:996 start_codon:yes stop_codon:yes gene_type:complete